MIRLIKDKENNRYGKNPFQLMKKIDIQKKVKNSFQLMKKNLIV